MLPVRIGGLEVSLGWDVDSMTKEVRVTVHLTEVGGRRALARPTARMRALMGIQTPRRQLGAARPRASCFGATTRPPIG